MKRLSYGFASALCAGGLAMSAQASNIELDFIGAGAGQAMTINYTAGDAPSGGYFFQNGTTANVLAGQLIYTVGDVSGDAANWFSSGQSITVFCSDIFELASGKKDATFGSVADMPEPAPNGQSMGSERASLLSVLYANNYEAALTGSNQDAAAFQLAIWEIVHETALTLDAGDFDGTGLHVYEGDFFATETNQDITDTMDLAQGWLKTAWENWSNGASGLELAGVYSAGFQDVIVVIPLPAPVLMAGLGLLAVPLIRRRVMRS